MTAKEMAKIAKEATFLFADSYIFAPNQFQEFVNQLCKEQRELDIKAIKGAVLFPIHSLNESIQDLMIDAVMKAKQLDIEEIEVSNG